MTPLIQIWKYAVTESDWVPLCCPVAGACLKAWFLYDGDLHLRSDPANPTTDYLAALADGNEFSLPVTGPVTMDGQRPLAYVQAAAGTVNVTCFFLMQ